MYLIMNFLELLGYICLASMAGPATNSKDVCDFFVEGSHHRNLSIVCIMQNAFSKGKGNRAMSSNSQYIVHMIRSGDGLIMVFAWVNNLFIQQEFPLDVGPHKSMVNGYCKTCSGGGGGGYA
jgi:hypothetical protein